MPPAAAPAFPRDAVAAPARLRPALADLLKRFHGTLSLARQRRDLSKLSEHQLRDIGLDAEAAATEASRPVWDAPAGWR